jgi:hypothetical protein
MRMRSCEPPTKGVPGKGDNIILTEVGPRIRVRSFKCKYYYNKLRCLILSNNSLLNLSCALPAVEVITPP